MVSKDFAPIESDYAFFMSHSTEAANDLAEHVRELLEFGEGRKSISLLDFGCGSGEFTEGLLSSLNWSTQSLRLTLVEPVQPHRYKAAGRLARFSHQAIAHTDKLPSDNESRFDLIVSNHVLYYIDDLDATIRQFVGNLSPTGLILITIASWDNVLMQLWQAGFAKLKRPVPYNAAEDVEAALSRLQVQYKKKKVAYQLCFPDSVENRTKMLRFLFSDFLEELSADALIHEFDRYAAGHRIELETHSFHFVIG